MKKANTGKVSIRDVAKEVGVSITTVSRALNGYSDVSAKTKQKILEAVEKLDYAPDANARSMGGKAEPTIALLTSELKSRDENGFVYGLINGLYQQCSANSCEFMLLVTDAVKQEKLSFPQLCKKKESERGCRNRSAHGRPLLQRSDVQRYPLRPDRYQSNRKK